MLVPMLVLPWGLREGKSRAVWGSAWYVGGPIMHSLLRRPYTTWTGPW